MPSSKHRLSGSIILIGFMGSGKTSAGRMLAMRTGHRLVDTDVAVSMEAKMPIPEIFRLHGEPYFRALETSCLQNLSRTEPLILSTGGGIILQPDNVVLLRTLGFVVWMTADEEEIVRRVTRNKDRPLVQTADPEGTVHRLLAERIPLYRAAADCAVDTTGMPKTLVVKEILKRASQYFSG